MIRIKEKFATMSAPAKASVFFVICNIMQKGISLISAPIFTRLLTTEQYGVYSVFNSWHSIISIFATFNLSYGVFIAGLTKFSDDRRRFVSSMQGLSTVITGILFCIYLIGHVFWNSIFRLPTVLVVAMFIEFFFITAFGFWSNVQRNEYKYKALVVVTLIMTVSSPVFGVISVLSTSNKAEARILSNIAVQACVGLFLYCLIMVQGKCFFDKKYWKYALMFNVPLIPHYLSMTVLQQADRIMINNMVGSSEAAIYSIAYTISTLMTLVTQAINNSFTPFTYQSLKKKSYSEIEKIANLLLMLVSCGCIAVMAFGPEIIEILAPPEYSDAIWIIPPVAMSVYFMFLYPLFGNIEFYFEQTKFTMVASCVGAFLNVGLNAFFVSRYGYYAAGYTTLFCYIVFAGAHMMAYQRIKKKQLDNEAVYNLKAIFIISVCSLVFMFIMVLVYRNTVIRYMIIIIIATVLFAMRGHLSRLIKQWRNS